jgi:hypothetical protein
LELEQVLTVLAYIRKLQPFRAQWFQKLDETGWNTFVTRILEPIAAPMLPLDRANFMANVIERLNGVISSDSPSLVIQQSPAKDVEKRSQKVSASSEEQADLSPFDSGYAASVMTLRSSG